MSRLVENLHWARAATYLAFGVIVVTAAPSLKQSIFVLFILSVLACVESAGSMASARRAERRSAENPPSGQEAP